MTGTLLKLFAVALLLPQLPQEGRPPACGLAASSRKLDEYGQLPATEELSRLEEKLRPALQAEHDDAKAFIVAYAGRGDRPGAALARADRAKQALVDKESYFYGRRLNTLDCGRRETPSIELWITPVGASPPPCTPTLADAAPPVKEAPSPRRPARRRGARP